MANFNININEVLTEQVGEAVNAGDLLYLSTDGKWYSADATLLSKSSTELRMALESGIANQNIDMLVHGYINLSPLVLSPGVKYYVSDTAGDITSVVYVNTTKIIRYVGTAIDTSTFLFNPDQTFIHDNARKINTVPLNFSHTHLEVDITDLDKYTQAEVDALIASATDSNYVHTQAVANTTWTIAHSLGKYPCVQVFDTIGNNVEGQITHTDVNNLTITFNTAFDGVAYLN